MKRRIFLTLWLAALVSACSSSAKVQKSWVDKDIHSRDLQGVLVLAVSTTEEGRRAFEQEFTRELVSKGVHAVASINYKAGTEIDKDDVVAMASRAETDTVLVTLFAGRDETAVLHPGRKYYGYAPVYGRGSVG